MFLVCLWYVQVCLWCIFTKSSIKLNDLNIPIFSDSSRNRPVQSIDHHRRQWVWTTPSKSQFDHRLCPGFHTNIFFNFQIGFKKRLNPTYKQITVSVFHFRKSTKETSCFSLNVCLIFSSISVVFRLSFPALLISDFLSWATETRSFPSFKDLYSLCNRLPTWKARLCSYLSPSPVCKNSPQQIFVA